MKASSLCIDKKNLKNPITKNKKLKTKQKYLNFFFQIFFYYFVSNEKQLGGSYEVSFISLWMVSSESRKRLHSIYYAHDCMYVEGMLCAARRCALFPLYKCFPESPFFPLPFKGFSFVRKRLVVFSFFHTHNIRVQKHHWKRLITTT